MAGGREGDDAPDARIREGGRLQRAPAAAALPHQDDVLQRDPVTPTEALDGGLDVVPVVRPLEAGGVADLGEQDDVGVPVDRELQDRWHQGLVGAGGVREKPWL